MHKYTVSEVGGGISLRLPEVFGQLGYKARLLFLHMLQSSIVGIADFYPCERDETFLASNSCNPYSLSR